MTAQSVGDNYSINSVSASSTTAPPAGENVCSPMMPSRESKSAAAPTSSLTSAEKDHRWSSPTTVSGYAKLPSSDQHWMSLKGDCTSPRLSASMTALMLDDEKPRRHSSTSSSSSSSSSSFSLSSSFVSSHGPFASQVTAILKAALPFVAFLIAYGLNARIPILPRAEDAHCVRLWNVSAFEETVFGRGRAPHLLVSAASNPVLDALSAVPYLMHYLIPVAYPLYVLLFVRPAAGSRPASEWSNRIVRFYLLLGWSMWIHYAVWFVMPTAPPWVAANLAAYRRLDPTGQPPPLDAQPREGCAFARLDHLTGIPLFRTIFAGNPIPFASFPSGHVAWPTCVLVTQMRHGCTRRRRVLLGVYVVWVAWATMYSCHHYLSDIVAAVVVVFAVDRLITCFRRYGGGGCCCCTGADVDRKSSTGLFGDGSCLPSMI